PARSLPPTQLNLARVQPTHQFQDAPPIRLRRSLSPATPPPELRKSPPPILPQATASRTRPRSRTPFGHDPEELVPGISSACIPAAAQSVASPRRRSGTHKA